LGWLRGQGRVSRQILSTNAKNENRHWTSGIY
jgi:hypothetical protein